MQTYSTGVSSNSAWNNPTLNTELTLCIQQANPISYSEYQQGHTIHPVFKQVSVIHTPESTVEDWIPYLEPAGRDTIVLRGFRYSYDAASRLSIEGISPRVTPHRAAVLPGV